MESDEKKAIRTEKRCAGVSERREKNGSVVCFLIADGFREPLSFRQFEAKESGGGVVGAIKIGHAAENEKFVVCAAARRGRAERKHAGAEAGTWRCVRVVEGVRAVVEKRPVHVNAVLVSRHVKTPEVSEDGVASPSSEEDTKGIIESNEGV